MELLGTDLRPSQVTLLEGQPNRSGGIIAPNDPTSLVVLAPTSTLTACSSFFRLPVPKFPEFGYHSSGLGTYLFKQQAGPIKGPPSVLPSSSILPFAMRPRLRQDGCHLVDTGMSYRYVYEHKCGSAVMRSACVPVFDSVVLSTIPGVTQSSIRSAQERVSPVAPLLVCSDGSIPGVQHQSSPRQQRVSCCQ